MSPDAHPGEEVPDGAAPAEPVVGRSPPGGGLHRPGLRTRRIGGLARRSRSGIGGHAGSRPGRAGQDPPGREVRAAVCRAGLGGGLQISTGVAFYDHMLTSLGKHAGFDLVVRATGDVDIDAHHTVEDVAIVLGQALRAALGDKSGIRRFGDAWVPMDETLAHAAVLSAAGGVAWLL